MKVDLTQSDAQVVKQVAAHFQHPETIEIYKRLIAIGQRLYDAEQLETHFRVGEL